MTPPPPRKKTSVIVWIAAAFGFLVALALIVGFLTVPRLGRARMMAQESAALRVVTTLHTAQAQYYSQYGKFAGTLAQLGPPAGGAAGPTGADLIPAGLASTSEAVGYRFALAASGSGYTINANPVSFGTTGSRTFFSDQSMINHQHSGPEAAGASDPEMK